MRPPAHPLLGFGALEKTRAKKARFAPQWHSRARAGSIYLQRARAVRLGFNDTGARAVRYIVTVLLTPSVPRLVARNKDYSGAIYHKGHYDPLLEARCVIARRCARIIIMRPL